MRDNVQVQTLIVYSAHDEETISFQMRGLRTIIVPMALCCLRGASAKNESEFVFTLMGGTPAFPLFGPDVPSLLGMDLIH